MGWYNQQNYEFADWSRSIFIKKNDDSFGVGQPKFHGKEKKKKERKKKKKKTSYQNIKTKYKIYKIVIACLFVFYIYKVVIAFFKKIKIKK